MNRASLKAYEYFVKHKITAELVAQYFKQGLPICDVAVMLKAYAETLSDEEKQEVYRQLYFTAIDATVWEDVANYMYGDLVQIPEMAFCSKAEDYDEFN